MVQQRSDDNLLPTSWRASILETITAFVAVIMADVLGSIGGFGLYYVIGLFSVIAIILVPIVVLNARKKKSLLRRYERAITHFSIWVSAILVANMLTSAWTVFKVALSSGPIFAGPLAIGLFFLLALMGNRVLSLVIPWIGSPRSSEAPSQTRSVAGSS